MKTDSATQNVLQILYFLKHRLEMSEILHLVVMLARKVQVPYGINKP